MTNTHSKRRTLTADDIDMRLRAHAESIANLRADAALLSPSTEDGRAIQEDILSRIDRLVRDLRGVASDMEDVA